jgi:hypothetical protein
MILRDEKSGVFYEVVNYIIDETNNEVTGAMCLVTGTRVKIFLDKEKLDMLQGKENEEE